MPLTIYTRVRLLNDDHAKETGGRFKLGTECWLVAERTLKASGRWYTIEVLDERCCGHWLEVGPNEIESVDEPKRKKRRKTAKAPKTPRIRK